MRIGRTWLGCRQALPPRFRLRGKQAPRVWSAVDQILGEAERRQQNFEGLVNQFPELRQGATLSDGHLFAVRAILYVSCLQELDTLLHYLWLMKAHADGAYRYGMLRQRERCLVNPAVVILLVTEALKTTATYLTTATCNPATGPSFARVGGRGGWME